MAGEQPHLVVLAGPNGAGKSTAAPALLVGALGVAEFVNADIIAQGLSAFRPELVALQAGRIMLQRLQQLASQRVHFAFESTLAGRTYAPWIAELRQTGYICYLVFLWLPDAEAAIARVQERVRLGGHDVPPGTIRQRYRRGLRNFFRLYRPLADQWHFYDNSNPAGPRLLAAGSGNREDVIAEPVTWNGIVRGVGNGESGHLQD